MSVLTQKKMIEEMSQEFHNVLPNEQAKQVTGIAENVSNNYEIEERITPQEIAEKDELIRAYLDALKIEGKTEKTIEQYDYYINKFLDFVCVPPTRVNVFHVRRYLDACKARGNSDRTLDNIRSDLSAFFKWLYREDIIQNNPMKKIVKIKYEQKVKETYSRTDIYNLHDNCDIISGPRCTEIRNKALLALMESTGCRVSEICRLNREDIDFANLEIKVYGKGRKERMVYMDQISIMLLREYLNTRTDDLPALFIGKNSDRLTPGGMRSLLNKIADKAGVYHAYPHKFRSTLGTNLIAHGMPLQEVQVIFGHEDINTTMRYISIDQNTVKNSYNKYR